MASRNVLAAFPGRSIRPWFWMGLAGVVLAALAWPMDQTITNHVAPLDPKGWGQMIFHVPIAASFYVVMVAILVSFPNRGRLVAGFLAAILLSAVATHGLKVCIGRARPATGLGARAFDPLNWDGAYHSLPSGDASGAITLALLLGLYFPKARWVFYFYAGWIGIGRVLHNRHFASDVLAGWVIGALAVYLCLRWLGPAFYRLERTPERKNRQDACSPGAGKTITD